MAKIIIVLYLLLPALVVGESPQLPGNPDFAAVSWLPHKDDAPYKEDIRDYYVATRRDGTPNTQSRFDIPSDRFHELGPEADFEDFLKGVKGALNQLKASRSPNLVLDIRTHGSRVRAGGIITSLCAKKNHNLTKVAQEIVETLREFELTHPKVMLWNMYDSCFSKQLAIEIEQIIRDPNGPYTNGGPYHYNEKFRVASTSDEERYSTLGEFQTALEESQPALQAFQEQEGSPRERTVSMSSTHETKERSAPAPRPTAGFNYKTFLMADEKSNYHNFWSSCDPDLANHALNMIKEGSEEELGEGIRLARAIGLDFKPQLPHLIRALAVWSKETRGEALSALREMGANASSAEQAIRDNFWSLRRNDLGGQALWALSAVSHPLKPPMVTEAIEIYEDKSRSKFDRLNALRALNNMNEPVPLRFLDRLIDDIIFFKGEANRADQWYHTELVDTGCWLLAKYKEAVPKLMDRFFKESVDNKAPLATALGRAGALLTPADRAKLARADFAFIQQVLSLDDNSKTEKEQKYQLAAVLKPVGEAVESDPGPGKDMFTLIARMGHIDAEHFPISKTIDYLSTTDPKEREAIALEFLVPKAGDSQHTLIRRTILAENTAASDDPWVRNLVLKTINRITPSTEKIVFAEQIRNFAKGDLAWRLAFATFPDNPLSDENRDMRFEMTYMKGQPDLVAHARQLVKEGNIETLPMALKALGNYGNASDVPGILAVYANRKEEHIRYWCLEALVDLGPAANSSLEPLMKHLLVDKRLSPKERKILARVLEKLAG
jgi:hypothetical protein